MFYCRSPREQPQLQLNMANLGRSRSMADINLHETNTLLTGGSAYMYLLRKLQRMGWETAK